jgi:hypothetical protein
MVLRSVALRVISAVGMATLVVVLGASGCHLMPKKEARADVAATPLSNKAPHVETETTSGAREATAGAAVAYGTAAQPSTETSSASGSAESGSLNGAKEAVAVRDADANSGATGWAAQHPIAGSSGGSRLASEAAATGAPSDVSTDGKNNDDIRNDANARVTLHPDFFEVSPGSAVSVTVEISGAVDVRSVPFYLIFDPSVVKIVGAREGPFLKGDGNPTAFLYALNASGDRMVVGHSRLGPVPGITGDGVLCTINLLAVGRGDARLGVEQAFVVRSNGAQEQSSFDVGSLLVR